MKNGKYQLKDIPDIEVLLLQKMYSKLASIDYAAKIPFTYQILGKKYNSEKLVFKKMEKLADKGLIEYGVSLRTGWLTEKGEEIIRKGK